MPPPPSSAAAPARPDDDAVASVRAKSLPPAGAINWSTEYKRIWIGRGYEAWEPDKRWWEQEVYSDHEARILSVILGESTYREPTVRRPVSYLASKGRMSERSAYRALAVLCDADKAGVLARAEKKRTKPGGGGRYDVGEFTPVLARLEAAAKLRARPAHWDPPVLNGRSNTATMAAGTARRDAVRAAIAAAGVPDDDAAALHWLRAAERDDKAQHWLARAEVNAQIRTEAREKRATEAEKARATVDRILAELAEKARARPALPVVALPLAPELPVRRDTNPENTTMTKQQLLEQRPQDDLIKVLVRHADLGERWSKDVLADILEDGGRLADGHRKVLRRMKAKDERDAQAGRRPVRAGPLQGPGGHRPKGADR